MKRLVLCLALALPLAACSNASPSGSASGAASGAAASSDGTLKIGDAAPNVTLTLTDGSKVELGKLTGKHVLVYFYPKDDTPGCTVEAKGINEAWDKFKAADIAVYGVSMQDAESHKAFSEKYGLQFPLVVDTDGAVAKAFKVPTTAGFASRQSFLVGPDGKIKALWPKVDPAEHADAVLKAAI